MEAYLGAPLLHDWTTEVVACQVALDLFQWQFDLSETDVVAGLNAIYGPT
jgi:hypothetical protein